MIVYLYKLNVQSINSNYIPNTNPKYIEDDNQEISVKVKTSVNVAQLTVGYSAGWSVPVIPKLQDVEQSPLSEALTLSQASWVTSAIYIGAIIVPILTGWLLNVLGRKMNMFIGNIVTVIGYCILTFSSNYPLLIISRVIIGGGVVVTHLTTMIYVGETAPPNIRGILLTLTGIFQSIGSVLVYCIGPYISYQAIGLVPLVLSMIHFIACFWLPESPIYSVIKGNITAARKALLQLGVGENIEKDLAEMIDHINLSKLDKNIKYIQLITDRYNRKSLIITASLCIAQYWNGIAAVGSYTTTIFEAAASSIKPEISTIIYGLIGLLAMSVVPAFIENVGRRRLLMISAVGCCTTSAVVGVYFYFDSINNTIIDAVRWLPLVLLVSQNCIYCLGILPVPALLLSELFRPSVRSIGCSIVYTITLGSRFLSILTFGYMVDTIGAHFIFWIYASINLMLFIFTIFSVPETKGLSLMQIEDLLD